MIKNIVNSSSSQEEKHNIVKKCLCVLKLMIEESEKLGTARIKSHFGLKKRKIYRIKVLSQTVRIENCEVNVNGNTTMWELREIISKKVKACIEFIQLQVKRVELLPSSNGKTVIDMKVIIFLFNI